MPVTIQTVTDDPPATLDIDPSSTVLQPGDSASYHGTYQPAQIAGAQKDVVTVTIAESTTVKATAEASCRILTTPGISVTKICDGDAAAPGQPIYFHGTIKNEGNVTLNNIALTDTPPSGSPYTITLSTTTLAPKGLTGDSVDYVGSYIPPQTAGPHVNSVSVAGTDSINTDQSASASNHDQGCGIATNPAIDVTKTCSVSDTRSSILIGGQLTVAGNVALTITSIVDNPSTTLTFLKNGSTSITLPALLNVGEYITYSGAYPVSSAGTYIDTITGNATDSINISKTVTKDASCTAVVPALGRWTGGGSNFGATTPSGDVRVTKGMELHCDPAKLPNNIEINFGPRTSNKFHLDGLDNVYCTDDLLIDPAHPKASFDTIAGTGHGSYNGKSGATITFTFQDAGEPGVNDTVAIQVKDSGGNVVLNLPTSKLTFGNMQAH